MTLARRLLIFGCCCGSWHALLAQSVFGRQGNIYFKTATGLIEQVTNGNRDSEPALSPDGKRIVFVRETQKESPNEEAVTSITNRTQLWITDAHSADSAQLLLDSPVEIKGNRYFSFHVPQWSPDGDAVYFQIDYSVVSGAIVRLTVQAKSLSFVAPALEFHVIKTGKFKGDIAALQRRNTLAPSHYEWFWLLRPDGTTIDVIGQSKGDLDLFRETYSASF